MLGPKWSRNQQGRLEFEDVPSVPGLKPALAASPRDPERGAEVFYQVGKETTTVSGRTIRIKDALPELGAKWDSEARVWRMPAARTHELLEACGKKEICVTEVGGDKSKEPELF
jgi:hypothetical protein